MSRKRRKAECLTGGEKLLFCVVAVFFCATLLRSVNFAPLAQARETVQTWLTGELDLGKAVEAIGQFTQEEHLQSVFRDIFPNTHAQDTQQTDEPPNTEPAESTNPPDESAAFADAVESADLTDTLAARAASAFPDTVDSVVYPLDFSCRTPTEGTISSRFGARTHPVSGEPKFHYGLDIAAPEGTPILAVADGTVSQTGNNSYGIFLVVDHGGGVSTLYAHCSKLLKKDGQAVTAGEPIAEVGATGIATGNHLHIEVWRAGKILDPENYVMLT